MPWFRAPINTRDQTPLSASLAEVINVIRSGCDGAPGLITKETRIVSGMLFCSNDIEVLLHKAEWCFGVRLPADENALRYLFSLQPNDYLLIPQLSLPLLLAWFGCAFANADVGDFDARLTALCLNGGKSLTEMDSRQ